jgi:hypothetical protein
MVEGTAIDDQRTLRMEVIKSSSTRIPSAPAEAQASASYNMDEDPGTFPVLALDRYNLMGDDDDDDYDDD